MYTWIWWLFDAWKSLPSKCSPKWWWIWSRLSGSRYSPDKLHHENLRGPSPSKRTWHWGSGPLKFSWHVMTDGTWIVLGPFWCCICQPLFHGRCNLPHTTVSEKFSLGAKNNTCTYTLCFFARWHGMLRNWLFSSGVFAKYIVWFKLKTMLAIFLIIFSSTKTIWISKTSMAQPTMMSSFFVHDKSYK